MLDVWIKFLKAHEKLLLVAIVGLGLWFAIGKVDTLIASHDNATLHQATIIDNERALVNEGLAQQAASQAAQYKELAAKLDAQNAALVQANTLLATTLAQRQKTDATLPPSALVARWNTLVPQAGAQVSPNGVTLPSVGAVATVQTLEQVPVLQSELSNTNGQLANVNALLAAEGQQVTTLTTEVGALHLQITDDTKVCQDQIKVIKDAARKSKFHYFLGGVVATIVTLAKFGAL
jgi:hypothetical protein